MRFELVIVGKVKLIIHAFDLDLTDGDVGVGITLSWK